MRLARLFIFINNVLLTSDNNISPAINAMILSLKTALTDGLYNQKALILRSIFYYN